MPEGEGPTIYVRPDTGETFTRRVHGNPDGNEIVRPSKVSTALAPAVLAARRALGALRRAFGGDKPIVGGHPAGDFVPAPNIVDLHGPIDRDDLPGLESAKKRHPSGAGSTELPKRPYDQQVDENPDDTPPGVPRHLRLVPTVKNAPATPGQPRPGGSGGPSSA